MVTSTTPDRIEGEGSNAFEVGEWVTNNVGHLMGYWPRRDAKFREGPPKATWRYTAQELLDMGLKGVYLDEDVPEGIKSRELLQRPRPK